MTKRDTKNIILTTSLRLFSEKGYDGVGVREIAKEIGIRESALYKHYHNKQAIFDSILNSIEERYSDAMTTFQLPEGFTKSLSNFNKEQQELYSMCITMFQFYLKDEYGSQLRRLLTIEQYKNTAVGKIFRDAIINNGLEYITNIFNKLIDCKYYQDIDSSIMAIQFYSPLYLLLCKYDGLENQYNEALSLLEKHIIQFDSMYRRKEG
ncbi:MAG: TetR/AcrR family transcriptional regulator [Coprobacillaceae bacterium]